MPRRIFTSDHVLLPGASDPSPATVIVDVASGKITSVEHGKKLRSDFADADVDEADFIDAGDLWILPGLVDAHVHLNEPGRTEWEGFWTGTRAAASGGVTALVDMPLNSIPPTTTVANLTTKREAAQGQCWVDVGFWGGVVPGNEGDLVPLVKAGVKGFKCFLIESGVDEFPCVNENDLHKAMSALKDVPTVLAFHAELDIPTSISTQVDQDPTLYTTFLASRPQSMETAALGLITSLLPSYPHLRTHIVHLSASSAIPLVRAAKVSGARMSAETCFHYLAFASEDVPHGRPEFKCCPPIRDAQNRDKLWEAVMDGTIDFVVSDHSPCVAELKRIDEGDVMAAWGGISTLGLGLSVLWTEGHERGMNIGRISELTALNTAKHAGLEDRKGSLAVGKDADIVLWDPNATFEVTKANLNFKNKLSPYEGRRLSGVVHQTYVRGTLVYDKGRAGFEGLQPNGILI